MNNHDIVCISATFNNFCFTPQIQIYFIPINQEINSLLWALYARKYPLIGRTNIADADETPYANVYRQLVH